MGFSTDRIRLFLQVIGATHLVTYSQSWHAVCYISSERDSRRQEEESMEAMSATLDGAEQVEIPKEIRLELTVVEPEVILELNRHPKGAERDRFALSALRLGVQALRQASGVIDGTMIQREGENLLNSVRDLLRTSFTENLSSLSATLKQYFDPANGNLSQRLERLVKKDGELETLLARHLDGESSTITRTLAKHIGEQSPLLRLLSPTQSDGLLAAL